MSIKTVHRLDRFPFLLLQLFFPLVLFPPLSSSPYTRLFRCLNRPCLVLLSRWSIRPSLLPFPPLPFVCPFPCPILSFASPPSLSLPFFIFSSRSVAISPGSFSCFNLDCKSSDGFLAPRGRSNKKKALSPAPRISRSYISSIRSIHRFSPLIVGLVAPHCVPFAVRRQWLLRRVCASYQVCWNSPMPALEYVLPLILDFLSDETCRVEFPWST